MNISDYYFITDLLPLLVGLGICVVVGIIILILKIKDKFSK